MNGLVAECEDKLEQALMDEVFPELAEDAGQVAMGETLFFDLETVPDRERIAEIEGPADEVQDPIVPPKDWVSGSVDDFKGSLSGPLSLASVDYLAAISLCEQEKDKPRAGIIGEIAKAIKTKSEAGEKLRKKYSTSPEYCRIAALGFAIGSGSPRGMLCVDEPSERKALNLFWDIATHCSPIVGYNIIGFDLPVILVRSAILGIRPTRKIDLRKFNNPHCVDLMVARFGSGQAMPLKKLCRLYGIDIPAGDVDGSHVESMLQEDPEAVLEYCKSDVAITQELYARLLGYFC